MIGRLLCRCAVEEVRQIASVFRHRCCCSSCFSPQAPNAKSVSERIWEMSHHVRSHSAHRSHAFVSPFLTCQEVVRLP
jgi:hypothetical protein